MADSPNIRTIHISELKLDMENARRHNPRNVGQIERSISLDGFARSGWVSKDGTIGAGNATYEAAVAAGIEEAIIIETDGTKAVFVQRNDIESGTTEFRRLALADNRAAELADWDAEQLQAFMDDGYDLTEHWFEDELAAVLNAIPDVEFPEYTESVEDEVQYCECPECGHRFPK